MCARFCSVAAIGASGTHGNFVHVHLEQVAAALIKRGHAVTISRVELGEDSAAQAELLLLGANSKSAFNAVIGHGQPAIEIADYADKLDIPTVRFLEEREDVNVLDERPTVLVFPSTEAVMLFGDLIEEAPRIVLPAVSVDDAHHEAYALLEQHLSDLAGAKSLPPEQGSFWHRAALEKVHTPV